MSIGVLIIESRHEELLELLYLEVLGEEEQKAFQHQLAGDYMLPELLVQGVTNKARVYELTIFLKDWHCINI